MNAASAISQLQNVQAIFNYLSLLRLDDYKYPKSACIKGTFTNVYKNINYIFQFA